MIIIACILTGFLVVVFVGVFGEAMLACLIIGAWLVGFGMIGGLVLALLGVIK